MFYWIIYRYLNYKSLLIPIHFGFSLLKLVVILCYFKNLLIGKCPSHLQSFQHEKLRKIRIVAETKYAFFFAGRVRTLSCWNNEGWAVVVNVLNVHLLVKITVLLLGFYIANQLIYLNDLHETFSAHSR